MYRQTMVVFAVLLALGVQPAAAQLALSPRGIFGLMTRPLRDMLGHLRGVRHHYRHHNYHDRSTSERLSTATEPSHARIGANETATGAHQNMSGLNAYDDILAYAFWPSDYANKIDRYGYDAIAAAIVSPIHVAAIDTTGSHTTAGQNPAHAGSLTLCQNMQASTDDWLIERIEQAMHPNAAQLSSLDQLRRRIAEGVKSIEVSCRTIHTLSPTTRLAALTQWLWALHDAGILARHSIEAFYATLTDKQKAKMNDVVAPTFAADTHAAEKANQQYRVCTAQSAGDTERILDRIEHAIHPTKDQQADMNNLRKKSVQMAKLVLASCGQPAATNPLARLDAVDRRLVVMTLAATTMEVALNDFYASLDPNQKVKFERLGR